ncbi:MAG: hypothetical protein KF773_35560 [Deltaproteobacteria bacterium]|nr:hypothetical protein [Deltaproteobacteria bacterium]
MTRAFQIRNEGVHHPDDSADATLVEFPGSNQVYFQSVCPLDLPATIYFEANFETLKTIDYPLVSVPWPVMSKRMLEALRSAGEFEHRAVPVTMLDDTVEEKFDTDGKPRPGVANFNYVVVQLTKHLDAFDWERSEYTPVESAPDKVWSTTHLMLKDVPLPPLFRLAAFRRPLFVSAEGRAALEKANVNGVKFIDSEDTY